MTQDIFLHIPKTAGSSIRTLLKQNYAADETVGFSGDPQQMRWYAGRPVEFKQRYRLVHGHVSYGVHRGVSSYRYFTLFRDPIDRHFSDYFFLKRYENHPLHEPIARGEMSLADWAVVAQRSGWYQDTSTRLVSGENVARTPDYASLEKAKYHLRLDFGFVGLAERFDESVLILARRFGWKSIFYLTRNVSRHDEGVTPALRQSARQFLTLDCELYEFARRTFEESPELRDPLFAPALAEFREASRWLDAHVSNDCHSYFTVGAELPDLDALVRENRPLTAVDRFLTAHSNELPH
jgi:hypothetical protein